MNAPVILRDGATAGLTDYIAEQALLGAILVDNGAYRKVALFLRPEHFADALHRRIYAAAARRVDAGQRADVITLGPDFSDDPALKDRPEGVRGYLIDLARNAMPPAFAEDYGRSILDLALRRDMLARLEDVRAALADTARELPDIVEEARGSLADAMAGMAAPARGVKDPAEFEQAVLSLYQGERRPHFSAGWPSLDRHYRIRAGELTIVTGYPGSGKTTWVDAVAVNLARTHGWRFALCSFETPPEEHIPALAEKYAGQPFWPGPTARMTRTSLDLAFEWVRQHFRFIRAEDEAPTFDWLMRAADAAWQLFQIQGFVIDPYNEIEHRRPEGMTETVYITDILARLKRWAQRRQVHVWFIAHPAKPQRLKDGSYPPLSLYDISGSGAWNSKADLGVIVNRVGEQVEIDVRKVRFQRSLGCEPGAVRLDYDRAAGTYSEPLGEPAPPDGDE